MSPASQGNLEVERYIGSCLISSSVRVNSIAGKSNNSGSHSNVNYKGKKVADCGGSRAGKLQTGVLLNHRITGSSSQDHLGAGGYPSQGSLLPLCECGGLKFGGARYGSSGPTVSVGGSWTGLPLISMAASNSRRNRKPSMSCNGSVINGNRFSKNAPTYLSQTAAVVGTSNCSRNGLLDGDHCSQNSRTPLSRLAIHTQGTPLILAGRYSVNGRKSNVSHSRGPPLRQFRGGDLNVRGSNSIKDTRDAAVSGGCAAGSNSNTPNSDCISVASDESSGHSENSLPRIIKPRKRRKKDRKPPPTASSTCDTSSNSTSSEVNNSAIESPSIVTLKPYVPLCYELYDNGHWIGNRLSLSKQDAEGKIKAWEAENRFTFTPSNINDIQGDDERVSQTSEDDNQEPKLHHNFDDVEEEEEGLHVDPGALFPYPCPPSLCHCRYCDPSGLIWDVDQHCYSPFLTAPSSTVDNKSTSYSKSPFANIPLFLTPPPADVRSFDFFNKDPLSASSPLVFLPENDHSSVLRRSWSEPLPSSPCGGNMTNSKDESHCGFGTVCDDGNVIESRHVRKIGDRNTSVEVPASTVSVAASQSLEVSTEIVTSPNGHRDIEIKFYSSSPPAGTTAISTRDIKYSYDMSVCDERNVRSTRTSIPTSPEEDASPEETVNAEENTQQENCESSLNVHHALVSYKQDVAPCNYTGDSPVSCGKAGCNVSDHDFCEQSAKTLGEEVYQLRLHAEE